MAVNLTKEKATQLSVEYVDMVILEIGNKPMSYFAQRNFVIRQETATMISCVKELSKTDVNDILLTQVKEIAPTMSLNNGRSILNDLSEELFEPQSLNWGRIVALHLFVKLMLVEFKVENRLDDTLKEAMALWLGACVSNLSDWIDLQHERDGWITFSKLFQRNEQNVMSFLTSALVGGVFGGFLTYKLF